MMAGGALTARPAATATAGSGRRIVISAAWLCINALPAAMVLAYAHGPHSLEAHAAVVRGAWWGRTLTLTIMRALLAAAHEGGRELVDCAAV